MNSLWCGPCKKIGPQFKEASKCKPSITFVTVDIDKCKETAMKNGVKSVPTLMAFVGTYVLNYIFCVTF